MRRARSSQKDLKQPGAEKTPYAPRNIFNLSHIARDGPNRMKGKPLQIARLLIKRGIAAIECRKDRIYDIWEILTVFDG